MSNEEPRLGYYQFSFKKNPFNLKVGRLYQLMWQDRSDLNWSRASLTSFYCGADRGEAGRPARVYFWTTEPFLVVKLDLYTCHVLTAEGHVGIFSYSDHRDQEGSSNYRFDDIAELCET